VRRRATQAGVIPFGPIGCLDWAAVTAGLTVPYSSGAVEGHVNRIKMIKRQMYGRARPDLLRKRVLATDRSRQLRQSHFLMATDKAGHLAGGGYRS
jgi:hypothetical protein